MTAERIFRLAAALWVLAAICYLIAGSWGYAVLYLAGAVIWELNARFEHRFRHPKEF